MLVLSIFPGIDLLGMAFEERGCCVVRGPDVLWGGDIHRFHPPAGRFDGLIGGPPCKAHASFTHINKARGAKIADDLTPEFARCVVAARPAWWLMENAPAVPDLTLPGYSTQRIIIDNRWLGEEQARRRAFQFGSRAGLRLQVQFAALDHPETETTCLASEGSAGRILRRKAKAHYTPRRDWPRFCALQGLPEDFLSDAPFTVDGKYQAVGNGVPLPMGRAIARALMAALAEQRAAA